MTAYGSTEKLCPSKNVNDLSCREKPQKTFKKEVFSKREIASITWKKEKKGRESEERILGMEETKDTDLPNLLTLTLGKQVTAEELSHLYKVT